MSTADERIAAMLCRWAEAKYNIQDVARVDFNTGQHGPYSDVTPDIDAYVEVLLWTAERERAYEFEESYTGGLIKDILRFAITEIVA